jgi:hypothetical protein
MPGWQGRKNIVYPSGTSFRSTYDIIPQKPPPRGSGSMMIFTGKIKGYRLTGLHTNRVWESEHLGEKKLFQYHEY